MTGQTSLVSVASDGNSTLGSYTSDGTISPDGRYVGFTSDASMRHSSLDLTMNVYTDPQLLDVAGALDRLPNLNLNQSPGGSLVAEAG